MTLVGDGHTARKPLTHIPRHDAVGFSLCERDGQSVTLNSRNRARLSESATCTECQRVKREAKQEYERQAREAEQWAKENPEIFEDEPEQTAQETVHYCALSKSRFTACGLRIGYGDRSLAAAALLHLVTCDDCLLAAVHP